MKLVHKTGCRYNEVMRNLRILEKEGIIIYKRLGCKCFISLNRESHKTRILIKVIGILDTPIDSRQPIREDEEDLELVKYFYPNEFASRIIF
ncbi:MAG: hypothetical protein QM398_02800 [Thermoproteota archaeon]|jgi:predicted transcriptional regulator|nr:hypothetical protein [Thermoproteota archaeon]NLD67115.1 hypothetical protein [Thermoproteota archaeon]